MTKRWLLLRDVYRGKKKQGLRTLPLKTLLPFPIVLHATAHRLLEVDGGEEGSDAAGEHDIEGHHQQICHKSSSVVSENMNRWYEQAVRTVKREHIAGSLFRG